MIVLFCLALPAYAHVAVKPNEVGIGSFQTFTIGVPVEKDVPTVGLRILIPAGLEHVSPNVKPGWKITIKKDSDAPDAKVTEIEWTGGVIPSGQRDDFFFSAKATSTPYTLQWKAYQNYQDRSVVAWTLSSSEQPKKEDGSPDFSKFGPYSETNIVDDLSDKSSTGNTSFFVSIIALVISFIALMKSRKNG